MEKIILVGHGSPRKEANRMEMVGKLLHASMHPGCAGNCVRVCYLQFEKPGLEETLAEAAGSGAEKIIVHPFFLNDGMHVTKDIPEAIAGVKSSSPATEFILSEPLGVSAELVDVARERIMEACGLVPPQEIENRSFEKINRIFKNGMSGVPDNVKPIVRRVVHATADPEYISGLIFHPDAINAGIEAVRAGMDVVTDVEMAAAGINEKALKKFGGRVVCSIRGIKSEKGKTRAEAGMEQVIGGNTGIVAIGNAPTALLACIKKMRANAAVPRLVVGVPVGFVRAVEAKALLAAQKFPHITNAGRKGGSPAAAAIVNAIIKLAEGK
ncbi:MAG: precorrin-8X methylmutase [Actinomycetota bacterium]|nr:precorrin-8X methylmutase [Actinomycetota bacterium]